MAQDYQTQQDDGLWYWATIYKVDFREAMSTKLEMDKVYENGLPPTMLT